LFLTRQIFILQVSWRFSCWWRWCPYWWLTQVCYPAYGIWWSWKRCFG